MAAEECVKKAVRSGDLGSLSAQRFGELGIELDEGLGVDQYSALHWACHHGKAEVRKIIDTQCSLLARPGMKGVLNAGASACTGVGCKCSFSHQAGMDGGTHLCHQGLCNLPSGQWEAA